MFLSRKWIFKAQNITIMRKMKASEQIMPIPINGERIQEIED